MKIVYPPALKEGDTIGIMAPSNRIDKGALKKAVAALKERGFNVYIHPQTYAQNGQSAGKAEQKVKALHDLFRDKSIKAIFCARGGNRAGTMLPDIDYKLIGRNPKIVMGYSDVTALLNAINKETSLVTFHGPMAHAREKPLPPKQVAQCFNLLGGKKADMPLDRAKTVNAGRAEGKLAGGNLSLLCSLMGTPWQPDFKGKILFIEDTGDQLTRYDRMLHQLRNAGVFDQIAGLIIGDMSAAEDKSVVPMTNSLRDIVRELTQDLDIPVVMNAPFGHGKDLYTLPVGAKATLTAGKHSSLKLKGPAVR
jgi:muramoyltetrapeptide carboxypeptidase